MKKILLAFATYLSYLWQLVPWKWRKTLFFGMFVLDSRGRDQKLSLQRLFAISDELDLVINERAMAFGQGEHPKHYLMPYHEFFIERIPSIARVLDVGCGYGAVSRSIALARPNCIVLGLDNNRERLNQAMTANNISNLSFLYGDINTVNLDEEWDVVILSNVLEHIHNRVEVLQQIAEKFSPTTILIRVPMFERSWTIALRKQMGVNYFQDSDHKIEHTVAEFKEEISAAGLYLDELHTLWGEIWAKCYVVPHA